MIILWKVLVLCNIKMEVDMKGNLKKIKKKEKEKNFSQMAMFMKENLKMINLMEKEFIFMKMEINI